MYQVSFKYFAKIYEYKFNFFYFIIIYIFFIFFSKKDYSF